MRKLLKVFAAAVLITVVATGLIGCAKKSGGTIKIGVISSVTGGGAAFGVNGNNAIKLAIEEINNAGGINGKTLEAIYLDSQSVPTTAVNLVQKLIYEDKVSVVVGSTSSLDTLAMMPVTEKEKIPLLCPSAVATKITEQGFEYIFRGSATDNMLAENMAKYVGEKLAWKKVAILYENSDYGAPPAKIVQETLNTKYNIVPVAMEAYNKGDPDFTALLAKVKSAEVDGIVTWGYYSDIALIARQARQVGISASIIGNSGLPVAQFPELVGADGEGIMAVVSFTATDPSPKAQELVKNFKAKYGYEPDNCAAYSYDCTKMLGEVLKKCGTEPEAILTGLRESEYVGATGRIKFEANGQSKAPATVVKLTNGSFVMVEKTGE